MTRFQLLTFDDLLRGDDLIKAHVKAHFRRDPQTGKLIWIKDYDSKIHGKPDHTIHAGKQYRIDNPKSKHHGKIAVADGYVIPKDPNKKPYVALKVNGVRADLQPHHLVPHGLAQASTQPASAKPITTLDDAKAELGLMGLSFAHPDMQHEQRRISSMSVPQLENRVGKIKNAQKLYNFLRAVEQRQSAFSSSVNPYTSTRKKIEDRLIEMAQVKRQVAQASKPAPTAQTPSPAPSTPKTANPATTQPSSFQVGDIVTIKTGKYAGKKGKITHMGGKYGVRVRVDLTGTGNYTKIAEYKKPDTNFEPKAGQTPAPTQAAINDGGGRGKDKKKRKTRSDKGDKRVPDTLAAPKIEKFEDFPNDRGKAYELAPDAFKHVAHATGLLPLDEATRQMMSANLQKLAKYWTQGGNSNANDPPGKVPRWVRFKSVPTTIASGLVGAWEDKGGYPELQDVVNTVLNASAKDWEAAGFDYNDDIAPAMDDLRSIRNKTENVVSASKVPEVLNDMVSAFATMVVDSGPMHGTPIYEFFKKKGFTIDTPINDIVYDPEFEKLYPAIYKSDLLEFAAAFNDKSMFATTFRDVLTGIASIHKGQAGPAQSAKILDTSVIKSFNANEDEYGGRWKEKIETAAGALNFYSYNRSDILDTIHGILDKKPGMLSDRKIHSSPFASISFRTGNVIGSEVLGKKLAEPKFRHLKDIIEANVIAQDASTRYSNAGNFKATLFHKNMLEDLTPKYAGLTAGRRKGSTDINVARLAKKYLKVRKKKAPNQPNNVKATIRKVDDKTAQDVIARIEKTWDTRNHGHFKPKVHGVYQIGGTDLYEKFHKIMNDRDNGIFAYHGTDFAAGANIARTQFSTARTKAGRMLGNGVYVTRTSSKACQYLGENFTRARGTRGVLFVNRVSLGKVHDKSNGADNSGPKKAPTIASADSIYAPKGKIVPGYGMPIVNDETCVKKTEAVLPMYWVDIELT